MKTNRFYDYFKKTEAGRDYIFKLTCSLLRNKPANIMEVGCTRVLTEVARKADGWSTYFWYEYIKKNGGRLDIYDTDYKALQNCKKLFENLPKINMTFNCKDAADCTNKDYDLVFLDGSDCPKEMVEQFERIDRSKTLILCDDFNVKGSILREKHKDFSILYLKRSPFEMALYNTTN